MQCRTYRVRVEVSISPHQCVQQSSKLPFNLNRCHNAAEQPLPVATYVQALYSCSTQWHCMVNIPMALYNHNEPQYATGKDQHQYSILTTPHPHRGNKGLVHAAIRHAKDQLDLDLSPCTSWLRFVEVHYARPHSSSLGVGEDTSEVCSVRLRFSQE